MYLLFVHVVTLGNSFGALKNTWKPYIDLLSAQPLQMVWPLYLVCKGLRVPSCQSTHGLRPYHLCPQDRTVLRKSTLQVGPLYNQHPHPNVCFWGLPRLNLILKDDINATSPCVERPITQRTALAAMFHVLSWTGHVSCPFQDWAIKRDRWGSYCRTSLKQYCRLQQSVSPSVIFPQPRYGTSMSVPGESGINIPPGDCLYSVFLYFCISVFLYFCISCCLELMTGQWELINQGNR